MEFTEQGLVLRIGRFREADLWVRFLSRRHGVLTGFAFGGSRSRRRFSGCLDVFNMLSVSVKSTRGGEYLSLQEATLLRGPNRLRHDWRRCGMAINCLRFVEALGAEADFGAGLSRFTTQATVLQPVTRQGVVEQISSHADIDIDAQKADDSNTGAAALVSSSRGIFCCELEQASLVTASSAISSSLVPLDLALNMLQAMEEASEIHPFFPVLFRARYAFSQGYEPRLNHCAHCGCARQEHDRHRFLVREGIMLCSDCLARVGTSGPFVDVARETLDALHFVQDISPLQWPELCISPTVRREFSRAVDGFIQYHIGLTWEGGRFRRL